MATKKKDEYQNTVKSGTGPADVGPGTKHDSFLALMGKAPSATGTTAPAYTPTAAPTFKPQDNPWYQQAQQLMGQIQNRAPFQFNLNQNALYQQYKDNYMKQGQQAMMDTMGQAAGLTGGYGSSYAQNVGQQAYNDYLTKLGDIVPELYAQERAAYDAEGNNLYQMLSAARGMYDTDYGIWRDQVGDARYQDELAYARSRDAISDQRYQDELAYGRQRDTLNDLWRQREYDDSRADLLYNRQYQEGRDALSDARYAEELAYGRSRDQLSDQRYEREYNDSRSDAVYSRVMQQISSGYMPSAEELQAAGISQGYARYLVNLYAQQQAAAAQGRTGGSNPGYVPQTPPQTPPETPPQTPPAQVLDDATYNGVRQTIYYALGSGDYQRAMNAFEQVESQLSQTQYNTLLAMFQEWIRNHPDGAAQNPNGSGISPVVPKPGNNRGGTK